MTLQIGYAQSAILTVTKQSYNYRGQQWQEYLFGKTRKMIFGMLVLKPLSAILGRVSIAIWWAGLQARERLSLNHCFESTSTTLIVLCAFRLTRHQDQPRLAHLLAMNLAIVGAAAYAQAVSPLYAQH